MVGQNIINAIVIAEIGYKDRHMDKNITIKLSCYNPILGGVWYSYNTIIVASPLCLYIRLY